MKSHSSRAGAPWFRVLRQEISPVDLCPDAVAENLPGIEEQGDTEQPIVEQTTRVDRKPRTSVSVALIGLFIIAIFFSIYFARDFFVPVTLALIFKFLLSPFVRALKRMCIPEAAGAGLVIIAGFIILGFFVYEFSSPVNEWVTRAPQITEKISGELRKFKKPVERVVQATEKVGSLGESGTQTERPIHVAIRGSAFTDGLLSRTRDAIFGLTVLIVLLYFLLSSGDLFLRKLVHVLPTFNDQRRAILIFQQIEDHISKYLITVAMINAGLGGAATLAFWLLGMPNPALWGALGFTLNFIPYLGALTEIAIVGVVAAASFPNFPHALLVPAAYLVLAVTEGSLVTPYVMGRRMMLNPVVVFVGVTLGGFLWSFIGVFLAVPMLVMFKIVCDHIEPLAPIGEFLGS